LKKETNTGGWPYEDIVDLPRHVSTRHTPMPMIKRAAQFLPFAALTGYDDALAETARLTEDLVELTGEVVRLEKGGHEHEEITDRHRHAE